MDVNGLQGAPSGLSRLTCASCTYPCLRSILIDDRRPQFTGDKIKPTRHMLHSASSTLVWQDTHPLNTPPINNTQHTHQHTHTHTHNNAVTQTPHHAATHMRHQRVLGVLRHFFGNGDGGFEGGFSLKHQPRIMVRHPLLVPVCLGPLFIRFGIAALP